MRHGILHAVASLALCARVAAAQAPAAAEHLAGTVVSGTVRDSVARAPLGGAWVQLVASDGRTESARTVMSDSLGRYAFDDVPDGRYSLGFFHPLLDSLGIEPRLHAVTIVGRRAVHADLGIPSGATLNAMICGVRSGKDSGVVVNGAAVVGVVRTVPGGAPAAGVTVNGDWLEISFTPGGIDRRRPRLVVTTGSNGWFALCNAPAGGTMFLIASRGADSTDMIDAEVPAEGFLRRDLYLGAARTVAVRDTTTRADSLALRPQSMHVGDGRVRGTVVTVEGERALTGAQVRVAEGPMSRADNRGEWFVGNAPLGTRVLEVHAVGFYPLRRSVDVMDGAPPTRLALSTFKAVLDTVKIVAKSAPKLLDTGFDARRRTGMGTYLTAEDLVRRGVIETSDVFKNLPGVRIELDTMGQARVMVRSAFGNGWCQPATYIDGLRMFSLSADELDTMARAKNVRAIEVYNEATMPPQFEIGLSGCGAIVIWMK